MDLGFGRGGGGPKKDSNRAFNHKFSKDSCGFFVTSRSLCSTAVGVLEEFLQWLYQGLMQIAFVVLQGLGVSISRGFSKL